MQLCGQLLNAAAAAGPAAACCLDSVPLLQSGFDNAPLPVADRAGFDFAAYAAASGMRGPVGAVYFVTLAA